VVILAPLFVERFALAGAGRPAVRIGKGPRRAARSVARLDETLDRVIVAGVAGALTTGLDPGDLVVADEVRCGSRVFRLNTPAALVDELREAGLTVHIGPVISVRRLAFSRPARERLADSGAIAVDMESGPVAETLDRMPPGGSLAVVRAVVDTPDHALLRPGTAWRGISALRALRRAAPVLAGWAPQAGPSGPGQMTAASHPEVG
jgi:4-hydroxy-3-methylbut-2-enyl diphosphate reductase